MCSRNVKRPARGAGPARAAGCRLKGARSVSPAPPPAPHRGGHEPRQQRVTRGSGTGTSWQANAARGPCAARTGRTHRLAHLLPRDGTDQGNLSRHKSSRQTPSRGCPAPVGRPGGDRPWGTEAAGAVDRAVAVDPARGPEGAGRTGSVQAPPAPSGDSGSQVPDWHRGPERSRYKGGKQAKLPHKKGATPAGGESRGRRTVQVRVRTPEPSSREA